MAQTKEPNYSYSMRIRTSCSQWPQTKGFNCGLALPPESKSLCTVTPGHTLLLYGRSWAWSRCLPNFIKHQCFPIDEHLSLGSLPLSAHHLLPRQQPHQLCPSLLLCLCWKVSLPAPDLPTSPDGCSSSQYLYQGVFLGEKRPLDHPLMSQS